MKQELLLKLKNFNNFKAPDIDKNILQGDVPGAKIDIFEGNFEQVNIIFKPLLELLFELAKKQDKVVVSVSGGSGVGKTGISSILAYYLRSMNIGTYMMSGDNYPKRIPVYNDAERLRLFRQAGIKGMIEDGVYTKERFDILKKFQEDFTDASYDYVKDYDWYKSYIDYGKKALEQYLGSDLELDFKEVSDILKKFKNGEEKIFLKRLGRSETELWYDEIDFSNVNILILEWTHGNSDYLEGVDIPIFLNSTPKETLEYRKLRNKDGNIDSAFVSMVLEIEQNLLHSQAYKAKIILSRNGEILSYKDYLELIRKG